MTKNPLPAQLKSLNSYMKTANEFDQRDPVISYYCRLYAVQKGMEIDRSSNESKRFLMEMMDILDTSKKELKDNENIESETVGQAYVEQYALKLFSYADKKDRDADFGAATIRSFITAGFLMDVLAVFGEVPEDVEKCRKYAKWKAVYINQCLKNGEAPHPGPLDDGQDIASANQLFPNVPTTSHLDVDPNPKPSPRTNKPSNQPDAKPNVSAQSSPLPSKTGKQTVPPYNPSQSIDSSAYGGGADTASNMSDITDFIKAEKLCKFALSSLQYQDSAAAIKYLTDCLALLKK